MDEFQKACSPSLVDLVQAYATDLDAFALASSFALHYLLGRRCALQVDDFELLFALEYQHIIELPDDSCLLNLSKLNLA